MELLSRNVKGLHHHFIASDLVEPDLLGTPIHERYQYICITLPIVARRTMYDDMSDIYHDAYHNMTGNKLWAAFNLAGLQMMFYQTMWSNRMIPRHVRDVKSVQCAIWKHKLGAKGNEVRGMRRSGDRIRQAQPFTPPKVWEILH